MAGLRRYEAKLQDPDQKMQRAVCNSPGRLGRYKIADTSLREILRITALTFLCVCDTIMLVCGQGGPDSQ